MVKGRRKRVRKNPVTLGTAVSVIVVCMVLLAPIPFFEGRHDYFRDHRSVFSEWGMKGVVITWVSIFVFVSLIMVLVWFSERPRGPKD